MYKASKSTGLRGEHALKLSMCYKTGIMISINRKVGGVMTIGRSMSVLLQTAQFNLPAAESMYVCLQLTVALTLAADWLFPFF